MDVVLLAVVLYWSFDAVFFFVFPSCSSGFSSGFSSGSVRPCYRRLPQFVVLDTDRVISAPGVERQATEPPLSKVFRFALSKVVLCMLTCLLCVCFLAVGWPWQLCFFQLLLPVVFLLSSQVMIAHMDLGRASGSAITIWNEYVLAQLRRCVNRKGCKSAHRNWKATAAPMTTYMCGHRTSQLLLPGMRCFACDMIL